MFVVTLLTVLPASNTYLYAMNGKVFLTTAFDTPFDILTSPNAKSTF